MRLLFVHERFGALAGAEVNLRLTAAELKNRGHSVGLLHGAPTGRSEEEWRELFPERARIDSPNPSAAVTSFVNQFQPDAIYIHKTADLAVLRALRDSRVPVARMVHDHDLYCLRSYKYFPLSRRVCTHGAGWHCVFPCGATVARNRGSGRLPFKWLSYRAKQKEIAINRAFDRMIVATDFMKGELLRNRFDPGRIQIHAPVPRDADVETQSSFSDRNLVIYSGQVIRGKGVDVLLESLARVRVPFECMILGDGSHRAYCETLSGRLGLHERVRFAGYVAPERLQTFYDEASLAVVSSVWPEPFGAVGIEAMRRGLPVVAFDAGGIRDWLPDGEAGFLVPWMDRAQFAARVEQLLQDKPLARDLGARARRFAAEKFNFSRYIDGLETMFEGLVGACKPRSYAHA
jgi:glycosyltransferase involved in cell wall biosynthesis